MHEVEFENLKEDLSFIEGWEDRYRYIIELGQALTPLEEEFKIDAFKVEGCASQVWLTHNVEGNGPCAKITFKGASDAHIVQGLMAIAIQLFSGLSAEKIASGNPFTAFEALDLSDHISSQRSNGLKSMLAKMQHIAKTVMG